MTKPPKVFSGAFLYNSLHAEVRGISNCLNEIPPNVGMTVCTDFLFHAEERGIFNSQKVPSYQNSVG
jgi:hypothetical protein